MPRATTSLRSSQDSDCQPAGEVTVHQTRRGPAESRHKAITRCRQGDDAQGQPARGERVGWVIYHAGRLSHLAPLLTCAAPDYPQAEMKSCDFHV